MKTKKRKPKQHRNAFGQFSKAPTWRTVDDIIAEHMADPRMAKHIARARKEFAAEKRKRKSPEVETLEFPVGTFAKPKPTLWQRIKARLSRIFCRHDWRAKPGRSMSERCVKCGKIRGLELPEFPSRPPGHVPPRPIPRPGPRP